MREPDDLDARMLGSLSVRRVQPYEAVKSYRCPGCGRELPAGTGHYIVIPDGYPDLRRHWHRGCWDNLPTHRRGRLPH